MLITCIYLVVQFPQFPNQQQNNLNMTPTTTISILSSESTNGPVMRLTRPVSVDINDSSAENNTVECMDTSDHHQISYLQLQQQQQQSVDQEAAYESENKLRSSQPKQNAMNSLFNPMSTAAASAAAIGSSGGSGKRYAL